MHKIPIRVVSAFLVLFLLMESSGAAVIQSKHLNSANISGRLFEAEALADASIASREPALVGDKQAQTLHRRSFLGSLPSGACVAGLDGGDCGHLPHDG